MDKINQIKGNGKKFSHHIKCEFSLDNNISGKNTINSKIFQKIDEFCSFREKFKGEETHKSKEHEKNYVNEQVYFELIDKF